jgi:hypothetical protein
MFSSNHSGAIVAAADPQALHEQQRSRPFPPWLAALHAPELPAIVAALVLFGLLFAFLQVVRGAVRQGESRRVVAAAQAEALWRCNILRDRAERNQCRMQLRIADDAGAGDNRRVPESAGH